jgi:hypothetical protein
MKNELLSPKEQETLWMLEEREVKLLEKEGKLGKIGLIGNSEILNLLNDLSSEEFGYKVELITSRSFEDSLTMNIGSKHSENLVKLKQKYEDGISKGLRYSLWIVLYPIDHTWLTNGYEHSIEAQECEILLKPVKGTNYHAVFYSHEDPRKGHECIFERKKNNKLKPKCNYFASLLSKYLVDEKDLQSPMKPKETAYKQ